MKIVVPRSWSKHQPLPAPIPDYVSSNLEQNDGGVAENARDTALSVANALGRLIERLAGDDKLTATDITYIVHGYEMDAEIVP